MSSRSPTGIMLTCLLSASSISYAQVPDAIVARGEVVMLTVHADGAQIYECKANSAAQLVWKFREPVATLIVDGKTVGRTLRWSDLGHERWQRDNRQGGRSSSRCDSEGHPMAQAGSYVASWNGPSSRTSRRSSEPTPEVARLKVRARRAARC